MLVASVCAFTVLSTGLFSAERGKETVYAGLKQARSSLEPRGSVVAYRGCVDESAGVDGIVTAACDDANDTYAVRKVVFVVANAVDGQPVDLTPRNTIKGVAIDPDSTTNAYVAVLPYSDQNQCVPDLHWSISFIGKTSGDNLLEAGEKTEITVWLHSLDYGTTPNHWNKGTSVGAYLQTLLAKNKEFTLELKPPDGAVLTIQRTILARLNPVMDLN